MHYIHKLSPRQKNAAIAIFILVPAIVLAVLLAIWAKNRGYLTESIRIKTYFQSAQGLNTQTAVSFAGFKIGRVTGVRLTEEDNIEVTMEIDKQYQQRIHTDSVAVLGVLSLIGKKEIGIKGGTPRFPVISDGDSISSEEFLAVENIMDKVRPLIAAAEKTLSKIEEVINTFPNNKLNETMENIARIVEKIEKGESTAGKLLSADRAELYNRINALLNRITAITKEVQTASVNLPGVMEKTSHILDNASSISDKVREAGQDIPETGKSVKKILDNLGHILEGITEIMPVMKSTAKNIGSATEEMASFAPRVPVILDDIELTLRETLIIIESVKSSWPVKNMVPPEEAPPAIDPSTRETPYRGGME